MRYEALEGAIVFDMLGYDTPRASMVRMGMANAIPEYSEWEAQNVTAWINFWTCVVLLQYTRNVDVYADGESYEALRDFWRLARNTYDYRAIFDAFNTYLSVDIVNAWEEAVKAARPPQQILAPVELQTAAPETLDEDAKKKEA